MFAGLIAVAMLCVTVLLVALVVTLVDIGWLSLIGIGSFYLLGWVCIL